MNLLRRIAFFLPLIAALALAGCAPSVQQTPEVTRGSVMGLSETLRGLGPGVDPEEAERAARIAIQYALQLRQQYGVTDPPLIHNTKVNMGLRPRGLCYQWADDIEARLRQENFQTFDFHRAIANTETLLIDHSVLILSAKGDSMFQGVVIDGWRNGGDLFWSKTLEDARYTWVPRDEVFARRAGRSR